MYKLNQYTINPIGLVDFISGKDPDLSFYAVKICLKSQQKQIL